ncbi:MAG: hypothetical protein ACI9FU_000499 [Granulosicoccus sp.]|jgi:hypothetical protein
MKKFLSLLLIGLCISGLSFAQQGMEDVVYLKDGSIYRGMILEMVPNKSLKVQTKDGNVFVVKMNTVEKVVKEEPFTNKPNMATKIDPPKKEKAPRVAKPPFEPRLKGYFFQGQVMLEAIQGGIHIINGYKFGRFGYLGIGVGFDNVIASPVKDIDLSGFGFPNNDEDGFRGVYLPLFLFHQGDILKTRVTPFYAVEAGYAFALNMNGPFSNSDELYREGGIMGGAGIGVRFNSRSKRAQFSLLLNVNVKNVRYQREYYAYDEFYTTYSYRNEIIEELLFFPGLRFGVGF